MKPSNKETAVQFLQMVVSGKIDEAYQIYVDMSGKHHNAFFPAGFAALKDAMKESEKETPNKKLTVNLVIGDGDLVAVHSHLERASNEPDISVVHMFRFINGKIVEMWDCGQVLPEECLNSDGVF